MAKRVHLTILKYILEHQPVEYNYNNRLFLLQYRLTDKQGFAKRKIEGACRDLVDDGLIARSKTGLFHITEEGKKFLRQENPILSMDFLGKFNFHLKKYAAIISFIGTIGSKFF